MMDWNLILEVMTSTGAETWIVDFGLTLADCWTLMGDWQLPNPDVTVYCERGGT